MTAREEILLSKLFPLNGGRFAHVGYHSQIGSPENALFCRPGRGRIWYGIDRNGFGKPFYRVLAQRIGLCVQVPSKFVGNNDIAVDVGGDTLHPVGEINGGSDDRKVEPVFRPILP